MAGGLRHGSVFEDIFLHVSTSSRYLLNCIHLIFFNIANLKNMTFKSAILSFVNLQTENVTVVFRCHLKKRSETVTPYIWKLTDRALYLIVCMFKRKQTINTNVFVTLMNGQRMNPIVIFSHPLILEQYYFYNFIFYVFSHLRHACLQENISYGYDLGFGFM